MKPRQAASLGFAILGIYFVLQSAFSLLQTFQLFKRWEFFTLILPLVLLVPGAIVFLKRESLARLVFPDEKLEDTGPGAILYADDLFRIGLILMGVYFVSMGVAGFLEMLSFAAFFFLDRQHTSGAGGSFVIHAIVSGAKAVMGLVLVLRADQLTALLIPPADEPMSDTEKDEAPRED